MSGELNVRTMFGQNCSRPALQLLAGAVRIDHATDRGKIPWFVLGHCRPDFGHAPDNLVARHDRVIRGHELAPLVADRMKIGVADAAEQNLDLHVVIGWVASLDFG